MSQPPAPPNDFLPEPAPSKPSSNVAVPLIIGVAGCGCLVFLVLPILAAIALPSFLNQANKAREAEAENYVGAMLRAQQAHHIEYARFSPSIEDLQIGLSNESGNYTYDVKVQPGDASVIITASPKQEGLKSYTGAVYTIGDDPSTATTTTQLCKSDIATTAPPEPPLLTSSVPPVIQCAPGSVGVD